MVKVSYNKLWKLLIDRDIRKGELRDATGIGKSTLAKLGNNEHVSMKVLLSICDTLHCDFGDILEVRLCERQ